jgi:hypothetical protein
MARGLGTVFVELSLDDKVYKQKLGETLTSTTATAKGIEASWKALGIKSEAYFDSQRRSAENAYTLIKSSHSATQNDIVRAQAAATAKIKALNDQQFGHQKTGLDTLKGHWIAASIAIGAAMMVVSKAMEYIPLGAKAMQAEESFRRVAESANESADDILAAMKRVSKGTIDESDMMQKAVKGMVLGLSGNEMVKIMEAARYSARVTGEDVKNAYESITDSIATGMPKALKKYGLITKEEMAIVNAALKAGVEGVNLYEIAMMNAGIQQEKMGKLAVNAAEEIQIFKARMQDTAETVGKSLIGAMIGAVKIFDNVKQGIQDAIIALESWISKITVFKDTIGVDVSKWSKAEVEAFGGYGMGGMPETAAPGAKADPAKIKSLEDEKKAWLAKIKEQTAAMKSAGKDAKDMLAADTAANKSAYDEKVAASDHWLRLQKISGENDLKYTVDIIDKKKTYLDEFYAKQKADIIEHTKTASVQAAKIAALDKEYNASVTKFTYERIETVANMNQQAYDESVKLMMDGIALSVKQSEDMIKTRMKYDEFAKHQIDSLLDSESRAIKESMDLEADKYAYIDNLLIAGVISHKEAEEAKKNATEKRIKSEKQTATDAFMKQNSEQQEIFSNLQSALGAASKLYAEESRERALLSEVTKAATIAEIALQVQKNLMIAVGAVVNQGTGDPYSAFARIAAMIAVVAGVLSIAGIAFGSGGGASTAAVAPKMTASGMRSTVLGAEYDTESESIKNSLEMLDDILGDTYDLEYRELRGIHSAMKDLNTNIIGLARSVIYGTMDNSLFASGSLGDYGENVNQSQMNMIKDWGTLISGGASSSPLMQMLEPTVGIISLLPKLWGDMFGGQQSVIAQDTGLSVNAPSVAGSQSGGQANAQYWLSQQHYKSGGWFGSSSTWFTMEYQAAGEDVVRLLTKVYKNISDTLVEMTVALGTDMQATLSYVFPSLSITLTGKTGEEITKILKDYFSQLGDVAVNVLFGGLLGQYQAVGEGMMETAIRVLMDKAVIMEALKMTGKAFTGTIPQIIAFSESVIEMAGGLDKFTEAASYYYDSFYSDAEKMMRSRTQMTEAFADLNLAMPQSRNAYRDLVEGLDLMTESGKEAYVAMLMMAEGADKYYDMLDEIMEKLRSARESMRMEGMVYDQQRATSAQLSLMTVLDQARQGNFANIGSLDSSLSELTSSASSTALFATRQEYEANFYRTYNRLAELEGLVGGTIPIEEQQLAVLQQIAANTDPAATAAFISKFDAMSNTELRREYEKAFGLFDRALDFGLPIQSPTDMQLRDALKGKYPGMASGGDFSGGWRTVGESGPELEYTGPSRIFSNKDSKSLIDNSELVNEVKALRVDLNAIGYAVAKSVGKSAKITDRWDIDGLPPERT